MDLGDGSIVQNGQKPKHRLFEMLSALLVPYTCALSIIQVKYLIRTMVEMHEQRSIGTKTVNLFRECIRFNDIFCSLSVTQAEGTTIQGVTT